MLKVKFTSLVLGLSIASIFTSCKDEDTCKNGIKDGTEQGIDCGPDCNFDCFEYNAETNKFYNILPGVWYPNHKFNEQGYILNDDDTLLQKRLFNYYLDSLSYKIEITNEQLNEDEFLMYGTPDQFSPLQFPKANKYTANAFSVIIDRHLVSDANTDTLIFQEPGGYTFIYTRQPLSLPINLNYTWELNFKEPLLDTNFLVIQKHVNGTKIGPDINITDKLNYSGSIEVSPTLDNRPFSYFHIKISKKSSFDTYNGPSGSYMDYSMTLKDNEGNVIESFTDVKHYFDENGNDDFNNFKVGATFEK